MPKLNPSIFREYDIRGIAATDLGPEQCRAIGQSYATAVRRAGGRRIALGRDCRLHSPEIAAAFAEGVTRGGIDVVRIGEVPTPLLYYSLFRLEVDGGVMVTASHNTAEYNGFKMCLGREALHGADVDAVRKRVVAGDLESGTGSLSDQPGIIDRYIAEWKSHGEGLDGLEVVLDGGNGMAGTVVGRLFGELGVKVHGLFLDPDGRFPNHEADPTQERNLVDLKREVIARGTRLGIGYDGDADRIGAVDHEGRVVWGDQLLIIFARDLLRRGPATIICDVKCTDVLADDVQSRGGRLVMSKTGHSLIKARMKLEHAALAGEMSGHMFFADRYPGYDDAIYASLRLLNIVATTGKSLPELLAGLPPRVATPEIRLPCDEAKKFAIVADIAGRLAARYEVYAEDGARFRIDGGWGLVRASNTGPLLVLRFEAEDDRRLAEAKAIMQAELLRHGLELP